jgi:hypothetical protein
MPSWRAAAPAAALACAAALLLAPRNLAAQPPIGIVPQQPKQQEQPPPPPQPFPWWQLIPQFEGETPPPPPRPLPDLVVSLVEFDAERKDQAWVTVLNRGNADAPPTRLRIEYADAEPPKTPAHKVRDAVAAVEKELAQLPAGWDRYVKLARLKTFSAIDPSGDDPAARQLFREVAQALDPQRVEGPYRRVLSRPAFANLRAALLAYLASPPGDASPVAALRTSPTAALALLSSNQAGAGWIEYFKLRDLQRALDKPAPVRSDEEAMVLLLAHSRLAGAAADPRYERFLSHPALVALREALAAAVAEMPEFRSPEPGLPESAAALSRYFGTISTGRQWTEFFKLPRVLEAAKKPPYDREPIHQALLSESLKQAEKITLDEKYAAITAKPQFADFRDALQKEVGGGLVIYHVRRPVPFKPWEVLNPEDGKPIAADAELTLPDERKVKAGDFYRELNRVERQLNAIGYSLRDEPEDEVLQEVALSESFRGQIENLHAGQAPLAGPFKPVAIEPPRARPMDPMLLQSLNRRKFEFYNDNKPQGPKKRAVEVDVGFLGPGEATRLLVKAPDPEYGFQGNIRFTADARDFLREWSETNNVRLVNVATAPKVIRRPKEVHRAEDWYKDLGNSKYFSAYLKSHVELHGTIEYVRAGASGQAGARIFGNNLTLLSASAGAFGPKEGSVEAAASLSVLGVSYLDFHDSGAEVWLFDKASHSIDVSYKVHFMVGPIPVSVKLGARGEAGIAYGLMAGPLQTAVRLQPFVHTSGYAQGGIDAIVAGGGVEASLTLLDYDGEAKAELGLLLDSGSPAYTERYSYCHGIHSLDGRVSAYAFIHVPRFGIPPWKKKTYRTTLFDWEGFETHGCPFEAERTTPLYD